MDGVNLMHVYVFQFSCLPDLRLRNPTCWLWFHSFPEKYHSIVHSIHSSNEITRRRDNVCHPLWTLIYTQFGRKSRLWKYFCQSKTNKYGLGSDAEQYGAIYSPQCVLCFSTLLHIIGKNLANFYRRLRSVGCIHICQDHVVLLTYDI